jgi:hypothetical protein
MHELRNHPGGLDLVDDPIPTADGLYGHGGALFTTV